jgi:Flp pilus assembly protein TadG
LNPVVAVARIGSSASDAGGSMAGLVDGRLTGSPGIYRPDELSSHRFVAPCGSTSIDLMDFATMHFANQLIRAGSLRLAVRLGRRRFLRNEGGGAAVDFALVVLPFLAVLTVIIESAIVLLAGQVLQTSATSAARTVLTGQAQNAGYTAAQFKNTICANLTVMFNCTGNLYVDVESFSSFSSINLSSPTNANGTLNTAGFGYSPGNPGDIVVVRLIYQWPIIAANIGICVATACGLINSAGNTNTLVATVAFRNEPYTPGT